VLGMWLLIRRDTSVDPFESLSGPGRG
jgi:hypothetical protein